MTDNNTIEEKYPSRLGILRLTEEEFNAKIAKNREQNESTLKVQFVILDNNEPIIVVETKIINLDKGQQQLLQLVKRASELLDKKNEEIKLAKELKEGEATIINLRLKYIQQWCNYDEHNTLEKAIEKLKLHTKLCFNHPPCIRVTKIAYERWIEAESLKWKPQERPADWVDSDIKEEPVLYPVHYAIQSNDPRGFTIGRIMKPVGTRLVVDSNETNRIILEGPALVVPSPLKLELNDQYGIGWKIKRGAVHLNNIFEYYINGHKISFTKDFSDIENPKTKEETLFIKEEPVLYPVHIATGNSTEFTVNVEMHQYNDQVGIFKVRCIGPMLVVNPPLILEMHHNDHISQMHNAVVHITPNAKYFINGKQIMVTIDDEEFRKNLAATEINTVRKIMEGDELETKE
jgi:hypothetical protein